MNKSLILLIGLIVFVALLAGVTFFVQRSHDTNAVDSDQNHNFSLRNEKDFLEHMIPHHEEAIVSATIVLEKGASLRPIRELVEGVISTQSAEVAMMKQWYQSWYSTYYESTGVYAPMMSSLDELSGSALDKVFLVDMIAHHQMAVDMAEKVLRISTSAETKQLAESIITTQTREIDLIKDLIKLLPTDQ